MKVRNRRRRRHVDPIEEEIAEVRARAAQVGLRLHGEHLTARLPQARCTEEERERAEKLAEAEGITLSEYIRRCIAAKSFNASVAE